MSRHYLPNRINPDALALRHALVSSHRELAAAARKIVVRTIERRGGVVADICADLGIGTSTYQRWRAEIPEIGEAHARCRPANATGPKPTK